MIHGLGLASTCIKVLGNSRIRGMRELFLLASVRRQNPSEQLWLFGVTPDFDGRRSSWLAVSEVAVEAAEPGQADR